MPDRDEIATVEEYKRFIELLPRRPGETFEWFCATTAGWDRVHFEKIYTDYVKSTQIEIGSGDNATTLKGAPLERLARYFLLKGGVVTDIKSISAPQKWEVDGQGPLNTGAIIMCFGDPVCRNIGFQLYMEAKNHTEPVGRSEFYSHYGRMEEHGCKLGIFFSTSGYAISGGTGIAESINHHFLKSIYHLLLSFHSIYAVAVDMKAPLQVLKESLCYAANDSYSHDADVQSIYTKRTCHRLALEEYNRLFLH